MTQPPPDRLDRIEAIVESNSHAIQAILNTMAETQVERQELREATIRLSDITEGIANWLTRLDENQPTILRKLNNVENKVDRLLEGRQ